MTVNVFRSMLPDGSGLHPRIASDKNSLGVVIEGKHRDITVLDGKVVPNDSEGMSVSPSPSKLPSHRIPVQYEYIYPDARGRAGLLCWRHGDSSFHDVDIASQLSLRIDQHDQNHGLVGPNEEMSLIEFVAALVATQSTWIAEPWDGEKP